MSSHHVAELDERAFERIALRLRVVARSLDHVNILGSSRLVALRVNTFDVSRQASTRAGHAKLGLGDLCLFRA